VAWNLSEAMDKLSEVLDRVDEDAPQVIMRRGRAYVVMSREAYHQLTGERLSLVGYLIDDGPRMDDIATMRRAPDRVWDPGL
jgi:prevent-host-death family protein